MGMSMSGVRMNRNTTLVLFPYLFISIHLFLLTEMRAPVKARREHIDHHRHNRRSHREQPGEGKIRPRVAQARTRQALERVGKNMDEPSRENHTGSERLDEEENVVFRVKGWDFSTQNRETHTQNTREEDRANRGEFQLQRIG